MQKAQAARFCGIERPDAQILRATSRPADSPRRRLMPVVKPVIRWKAGGPPGGAYSAASSRASSAGRSPAMPVADVSSSPAGSGSDGA